MPKMKDAKYLSIVIEDDLKTWLSEEANLKRMSLNEFVRNLLEDYKRLRIDIHENLSDDTVMKSLVGKVSIENMINNIYDVVVLRTVGDRVLRGLPREGEDVKRPEDFEKRNKDIDAYNKKMGHT